jgi:hypothetical protein
MSPSLDEWSEGSGQPDRGIDEKRIDGWHCLTTRSVPKADER